MRTSLLCSLELPPFRSVRTSYLPSSLPPSRPLSLPSILPSFLHHSIRNTRLAAQSCAARSSSFLSPSLEWDVLAQGFHWAGGGGERGREAEERRQWRQLLPLLSPSYIESMNLNGWKDGRHQRFVRSRDDLHGETNEEAVAMIPFNDSVVLLPLFQNDLMPRP